MLTAHRSWIYLATILSISVSATLSANTPSAAGAGQTPTQTPATPSQTTTNPHTAPTTNNTNHDPQTAQGHGAPQASGTQKAAEPSQNGRVCMSGVCINDTMKVGYKNVLMHCPEVKSLRRKDMHWGTANGWISHDASFAQGVHAFVAAQWQGINVGKIMCVYVGDKGIDFPIALQQENAVLVPAPHGLYWGKNNGGVINCVAPKGSAISPQNCAFIGKQPVTNSDPTKNLDFFKDGRYQRTNS